MASRGPTTQSLDDRIDALSEDMKELTKVVRDFGGDLRWIKRIGAFVAVSLVAALAGSGRVIWEASAVNTKVDQQGKVLEEVRDEVKQQASRIDAIGSEAKDQDRRLDRVEKHLDGIDQKLDTLLSRTAPKSGG